MQPFLLDDGGNQPVLAPYRTFYKLPDTRVLSDELNEKLRVTAYNHDRFWSVEHIR